MVSDIAVAVSMTGFAFIMAYIGLNVDKKHSILGWLFIPISILFMAVNVFMLVAYETNVSVKNMLVYVADGLIVVLIFFLAYMLLFILTKSFEKLFNRVESKYGNKLEEK